MTYRALITGSRPHGSHGMLHLHPAGHQADAIRADLTRNPADLAEEAS